MPFFIYMSVFFTFTIYINNKDRHNNKLDDKESKGNDNIMMGG